MGNICFAPSHTFCCCASVDTGINAIGLIDVICFCATVGIIGYHYDEQRPDKNWWLFSYPFFVALPCIITFFVMKAFNNPPQIRSWYFRIRFVTFIILILTTIIHVIYQPIYIVRNYTEDGWCAYLQPSENPEPTTPEYRSKI